MVVLMRPSYYGGPIAAAIYDVTGGDIHFIGALGPKDRIAYQVAPGLRRSWSSPRTRISYKSRLRHRNLPCEAQGLSTEVGGHVACRQGRADPGSGRWNNFP